MQQDSASFWTDIKNYEERLAQAPDSLLFARLAEVYLKVGLVDDALHTARQGVEKHPGYIAGQRALALACQAKGIQDECLEALDKVTTALPEDGEAQKMLGRLLSTKGNKIAAIKAFRTALEFNPDDTECRVELNVLEHNASTPLANIFPDDAVSPDGAGFAVDRLDADFGAFEDEADESDEIIEDAEILDVDEADLLELEEPESLIANSIASDAARHFDPLSTSTLAELYLQQGFSDKALEIYQDLLAEEPGNADIKSRIAQLEAGAATDVTAANGTSTAEDPSVGFAVHESSQSVSATPAEGAADSAIAILEGWLDNIGRMKQCR